MGAFSPTEAFVLSFKSLHYFAENDLCINRMCALFFEPVGDSIFTQARNPLRRVMMRSGAWRRAGIFLQGQLVRDKL